MNEMGKRINMKRIEKGMTMEQLANALGVKASAINKYEKGIVENIKRSTIKDMAKIFDCSPAWLMGFDIDYKVKDKDNERIDIIVEACKDMKESQIKDVLRYISYIKTINEDK